MTRHYSLADVSRDASRHNWGWADTTIEKALVKATKDGQFTALDRGTLLRIAEAAEEALAILSSRPRRQSRPAETTDFIADAFKNVYLAQAWRPPLDREIWSNFGIRVTNCLKRRDIICVGQLVAKTADELLSIRHFGTASLRDVRARLAHLGCHLKDEAR